MHEFTNNEREIFNTARGVENFSFIVSERAMSVLTFLLFKLNTLQTKIVKL